MTRRFAWLLTCFLFAGLSTPLHAEDKAPVKPLRVALYDAEGSTGKGVPRVKEILAKEKDVELIFFKPDDIRAGKLTGFDVVMFTGGSGSKQAEAIGEDGRAKVKEFVEAGGGYIGICAGAYLACSGVSWGVKVLNAKKIGRAHV